MARVYTELVVVIYSMKLTHRQLTFLMVIYCIVSLSDCTVYTKNIIKVPQHNCISIVYFNNISCHDYRLSIILWAKWIGWFSFCLFRWKTHDSLNAFISYSRMYCAIQAQSLLATRFDWFVFTPKPCFYCNQTTPLR